MTLTGKELTIIDRCVAFYARTKYVFRCLLLLFIYFLFSFTIKSNSGVCFKSYVILSGFLFTCARLLWFQSHWCCRFCY